MTTNLDAREKLDLGIKASHCFQTICDNVGTFYDRFKELYQGGLNMSMGGQDAQLASEAYNTLLANNDAAVKVLKTARSIDAFPGENEGNEYPIRDPLKMVGHYIYEFNQEIREDLGQADMFGGSNAMTTAQEILDSIESLHETLSDMRDQFRGDFFDHDEDNM